MLVYEVVGAVLASLGGASLIIFCLANFLGNVWIERITAQVHARSERELEELKSKHNIALEAFSRRAAIELKEVEIFNGISREVYQEIFKDRIATYTKLLNLKNDFLENMHEDFLTEQNEHWGEVYFSSYRQFRKTIIENQLYISTDLDSKFEQLRLLSAEYIRESEQIEAYGSGVGAHPDDIMEKQEVVHAKLATETSGPMQSFLDQISLDVGKLRSRIDLDKA